MQHIEPSWICVHIAGVPVSVRGVFVQEVDGGWFFDWDSAWIGSQRVTELIVELDCKLKFEELVQTAALSADSHPVC